MRLTSYFGVSKVYMHFKTKVQNRKIRWSSSHKYMSNVEEKGKGS